MMSRRLGYPHQDSIELAVYLPVLRCMTTSTGSKLGSHSPVPVKASMTSTVGFATEARVMEIFKELRLKRLESN